MSKSAISRVKSIAWNTVYRWLERAAACCRRFNDQSIIGLDIRELQADEIRTISGGKNDVVWIFATIDVWSRLWPSAVIGRRSYGNTLTLIRDTRNRMTLGDSTLLIVTDGFEFYENAVRRVFDPMCLYAQVLKTRRNNRVVKVERRPVIGASSDFEQVLSDSKDSATLNTSFVERLNLTIRQGSAYLTRRSLSHARRPDRLADHIELLRCHYNFLRPHRALKFGTEIRTPAMQAGLASRQLTFREVFSSTPPSICVTIFVVTVDCRPDLVRRAAWLTVDGGSPAIYSHERNMLAKRTATKLSLLSGTVAILVGLLVIGLNYSTIVAWYEFRQQFEALGDNDQGHPEYRHRQTSIIFVSLPGGTFDMGAPETEVGSEEHERPVHSVTLSSFLLAKYEVSQAEWKSVMGKNSSKFKGDDLPVDRVSWEEARKFCEKTGLRLPSEAEWEYACRAGTRTVYHSGDTEADLARVGWYGGNAEGRTHPIGERPANDFGLHDMHGSVWEWCEDVYDAEFYSKPEASEKNPVSASGSVIRVMRGGCWFYPARFCRSAFRYWVVPTSRYDLVGFRPARSLRE